MSFDLSPKRVMGPFYLYPFPWTLCSICAFWNLSPLNLCQHRCSNSPKINSLLVGVTEIGLACLQNPVPRRTKSPPIILCTYAKQTK